MVIGLFGFYMEGNFGDDLMAYLIGSHLRARSIPFIICGNPTTFERYGFCTEKDVDTFIDLVDLVVLGGGGVFLPRPEKEDLLAGTYSWRLARLIDRCDLIGLPIYGVSVGGNGIDLHEITPCSRRRFAERASFLTVRNSDEVKLLNQAFTPGVFFHDIVWATPNFFPCVKRSQTTRLRIGLNLPSLSRTNSIIIRLIVALREDCDFYIIDSSSNQIKSMALSYLRRYKNVQFIKFCNIERDVRFIASLDFLMTSRLHIGVVAMSFRVPAVSIFAKEEKVRLLFKSVGQSRAFWGRHAWHKLAYNFSSARRLQKAIRRLGEFDPEPYRADSMHHFHILDRLVR